MTESEGRTKGDVMPPFSHAPADEIFLGLICDYAAALERHPGTPDHTATLDRVLGYVATLHAELTRLRASVIDLQAVIDARASQFDDLFTHNERLRASLAEAETRRDTLEECMSEVYGILEDAGFEDARSVQPSVCVQLLADRTVVKA